VKSNIAIHKVIHYQEKHCTDCRFLTPASHLVAKIEGYFVQVQVQVQVSYPWKGEVKGKTLWPQSVIVRSLRWLVRDLTCVAQC
jgi:hypothetical protein